jgi:VanZ family protein
MFNSISKSALFNHSQSILVWKLLFWFILALLLYLTLTPTPPKPISFNQIDKLYHFSAFAGFTFVFTIAFRQIKSGYILLLSIILGIVIEVIQHYIPNRGFSIADMIADLIGVLAGFWLARKIMPSTSEVIK